MTEDYFFGDLFMLQQLLWGVSFQTGFWYIIQECTDVGYFFFQNGIFKKIN